jgi:glycine hydroxymethyltransferase
MHDFLFPGSLEEKDAHVFELSQIEAERQYRRLILIPSESIAPTSVREALASAFTNIYAEGYPPALTRLMSEEEILDYELRLGQYRRYSDPRYYKGVEYVNAIEALARRRCAELFAANGASADDIFVNVQPLSGAPANNAVYHALVEPGEVVMGMDLLHGGHLSHGSPVNRSGKLYKIVHYGVDPESERIDYDAVGELAEQHRPRMIIAGYSSYPWSVDWERFAEIAKSVGAYLLADISHVAGPVAAGVNPSPVGIADVVTFTTHKSLCGPRGAVVITTDKKLAHRIDRAVFPGEQGGPHINNIAAQAVAFKLASSEEFKDLQKQILKNCIAITETLEEHGFRIAFGGTDTHLTNLDCSSIVGDDGTTLSGDQAARILDLAGIVVNRNTIPGDRSAANPSGIRLGTPWITQRGFKEKESSEVAELIARLLQACEPYGMAGRKGKLRRAKVDFKVLNEVRLRVRDLAEGAAIEVKPELHGYPHFYFLDDAAPERAYASIEIAGEHAESFLRWATDTRPSKIREGEAVQVRLRGDISAVLTKGERWELTLDSQHFAELSTWLRDLSDGFIVVDPEDMHKKLPGPVVIRLARTTDEMPTAKESSNGLDKPWYIGVDGNKGTPLPIFEWNDDEHADLKETALYKIHKELGAKMVPFAGWDMPVWYSSVLAEHQATRQAAGLFDVSHMGVYQAEGEGAAAFLDSVVGNEVSSLGVGSSLYGQLLDTNAAVIDDLMVYRRSEDAYLLVVNASNDDKDWSWLQAVQNGEIRVDNDRPWARAFGLGCRLRNLRLPSEAADMRVDLALQGPRSRDILLGLGCDESTAGQLHSLKWAGVMEGRFGGHDLILSRTGYTGERIAYELLVHPDRSGDLWEALLKAGEPFGLMPVGLGARDSLRTEAGLPLYGHEMGGELNLGVGQAGFAPYVKTHKPWFIGRSAYMSQERGRDKVVARFRFDDKGVRMAHYGDPVVDKRGRVIGLVTSCALDSEGYLLGQALLELKHASEGTPIGVFQGAANITKAAGKLTMGDRVAVPTPASVLSRFP